ncbi:MAG: hypothetical protein BWY80_00162 [Firmicutes bacterium ADurb.Bin456]|nr:MAG: hypothetical protein BWY80_00162 [Firmicutes bacterium ADurb.Bin456]
MRKVHVAHKRPLVFLVFHSQLLHKRTVPLCHFCTREPSPCVVVLRPLVLLLCCCYAKRIISLATGTLVNSFSGGAEANGYVGNLGFEVVELRDGELKINNLRDGFKFVFREYLNARAGGGFGKKHPIENIET